MSELKGFPIATVVFLALVFSRKIPVVRAGYDRAFEAVTGVHVVDPNEIPRKPSAGGPLSEAFENMTNEVFETTRSWNRVNQGPTQ